MCYARRVTHFRMKGLRRLRDASAARCCSSDFFREAAAALRKRPHHHRPRAVRGRWREGRDAVGASDIRRPEAS